MFRSLVLAGTGQVRTYAPRMNALVGSFIEPIETARQTIPPRPQCRFRSRKSRKHPEYQKFLHPAAKWKRILSRCDYWFSDWNLRDDEFLKNELRRHDGWCRISTLLTFPKFHHWTDEQLLIDALTSSAAAARYEVRVHASDPLRAIVRRKNVTLETIDALEREGSDDRDAELKAREVQREERAERRKKQRKLPKYGTGREIVVARTVEEVAALCGELRRSSRRSAERWDPGGGGGGDASALGFDVEYATLELDIRPRLPAMLQLSAPTEDGTVGLVWLDKLPDHGRSVLVDEDLSPLASLLADPAVRKVGVGAFGDAVNLASWWGVDEPSYADYCVGGLVDLREEPDPRVRDRELVDMCADVLGRDLPKRKSGTKKKKDTVRSHWRAESLTDQMKLYAAHDASCAVDVWMALKGFRDEEGRSESSCTEETSN